MGVRGAIWSVLKHWYPAVCALLVFRNLQMRRRLLAGDNETASGMAHRDRDLDGSLAYIQGVFDDYKHYARLDSFGGRVAEVGPGDNCGVGLLFLADGCESVDLVDRFRSTRDVHQQAAIYGALLDRIPALRARFPGVDLSDDANFSGITWHDGPRAAAERFFSDRSGAYDYIVSRAVLEHVYDPERAIEGMVGALRSGGMLLHKVDLRDHGLFTPEFHELKFLEVSDWLYPHLTRSLGSPNRVLVDRYREVLDRLGMRSSILVTRLAGVGAITPHLEFDEISPNLRERSLSFVRSVRDRFAPSLRAISDEDLCVAGLFIVAEKP
jgi:SAM-dependent methyltransferase